MVEDNKLTVDEARRQAQHEAVKKDVREGIQTEITRRADQVGPDDEARAETLARQLKKKAVAEVASTEWELERARGVARISQVVDYLFYLIYGIVGLEIFLELLGARESSGFKQFIDTIASPILAPFRGLMPDPERGPFRLMLSYIMAMIVYLLVHLAVNGLLRILAHKKTEV